MNMGVGATSHRKELGNKLPAVQQTVSKCQSTEGYTNIIINIITLFNTNAQLNSKA